MSQETIQVLLVEDNPDHAELIRRVLERQPRPIRVTTVASGVDCLEKLRHHPYSALLLDYTLSGMDGLSVLKKIRRQGHSVPVIMVTGLGDETVVVEAMQEGAADYLIKTTGYLTTLPGMLFKVLKQHEIALDNARLFEESRRQQEIQRLLKELSQDITSLDIDSLIKKLTEKVHEFLKVDVSDVRILEDGHWQVMGVSGTEPERVQSDSTGTARGRSKWILQNRKPLLIPDITEGEEFSGGESIRKAGVRGYLAVPLFSRSGEVIGILRALTYEPREFSQSEVDLLQQLANGAAIALTNARLFEEIKRRAQEQEALNAIAAATSQSLNLDDLLQVALDKVLEVTGRDKGYIRLKDTVTGKLRLAAHRGISQEYIEVLLHRRTPGGKSEQVFESGEVLVINDPEGAHLKEETRREGRHCLIWVPLKARGKVVGLLNLSTDRSIPFTPREVELLQAIANVIGVALENARLFGETQRSLGRVRALREIDQAMTSTLDLRSVLDVLLEKIDLVLPYAATTVRLFNKVSGLLEPVACRNLDEKEWKVASWKVGRGPANAVFESKAPLTIRNCLNDPRVKDPEFFRKYQLVSYLGLPMMAKEEPLGVLSFYTKEEHEFASEEVDFLSTLAGQAAMAIRNARLYEETERRRREAEELARVAQSLTETLDMTAVGERIVTSVRELFGVKVSTLRLLEPDGSLRALASSGEAFSRSPGGDVLSPGTGLTSRAVAEGRPVWSADMLNDPEIRLTDQIRDYQLRSGNRSMIVVPLRAHEKIIGALALWDQTGRIYSDSEVALVQTFADQAALALENARLYEEARTREAQLQESNRMLSALHSVAAAASQSLDLDRVLQAAIEKIIDIFRFDATGIYIYDEQMNELLLRVSLASDRERFAQPRSFARGQGIVGKVVESGKPLIFEDIETDPLYQQLSRTKSAKQLGHRFFAVFPVKGKLKNVGTLTCMGGAPRRLNSSEIQLLEAMADQIAVAIENSQLYGEMVTLAGDLAKSNRVKDEFLSVMSHELRTPLNVVMGYTGMIRDGLLGEINPEQEKALEKIISRARDQLTMISGILQAVQIEAEGVKVERTEVSLKEFLDDLRSSYSIPLGKELSVIWDYPPDLPVVHTDAEKLKHVLQNLINNAIKFTGKGNVTVSARCLNGTRIGESGRQQEKSDGQDGAVELRVSDTGVGIAKEHFPVIFERFRQVDSSETRRYGGVGIGLYIVKKFTELLGGKVEVESEPGKGSTFTVTIPLAMD